MSDTRDREGFNSWEEGNDLRLLSGKTRLWKDEAGPGRSTGSQETPNCGTPRAARLQQEQQPQCGRKKGAGTSWTTDPS